MALSLAVHTIKNFSLNSGHESYHGKNVQIVHHINNFINLTAYPLVDFIIVVINSDIDKAFPHHSCSQGKYSNS